MDDKGMARVVDPDLLASRYDRHGDEREVLDPWAGNVEQALQASDVLAISLGEALAMLQERLAAVLLPEPAIASSGEKSTDDKPRRSMLADRISQTNATLQRHLALVESIRSRVDV